MCKCDTGHSYRWAIIMEKFNLLMFKYIKLMSKWGFLLSLRGNASLWVWNWTSHIKARKRTRTPFVLCGQALGDRMTEECVCEGKAIRFISSPLSALNNRHILFFFICCSEKSHTQFVFCASVAVMADSDRIHPTAQFLFQFSLSSRPTN